MVNLEEAEAVVRGNEPPPLVGRPISSPVDVIDLSGPSGWRDLYASFVIGAQSHRSPWNRCLTLLHGLEAKTCVIERHYICLDYKSEILSFYSQLDASREVATERLHFFSEQIGEEEVFDLKEKDTSYLGYIVCRHGNLPLVGRCNIVTPSYIDVASTVRETIHFFGQEVHVEGVPFMQQDSQFAVCSQVTVWAAHYSAYRRGLVQRRLVAEIVAMSGAIEPMKPHVSDGLVSRDVAALFHRSGLSAKTYYGPGGGLVDYPPMNIASLGGASELVEKIRPLVVDEARRRQQGSSAGGDPVTFEDFRPPESNISEFAADLAKYVDGQHADDPLRRETTALFDLILAHLFRPYLHSRIPIYCGMKNHSVLLCGISGVAASKTTYFVHDDAYGPYLALDSLVDGSRTALSDQAYDGLGYPEFLEMTDPAETGDSSVEFPADKTALVVEGSPYARNDVERSTEVFIVPGPPRLLLTPAEAEADTYRAFARELSDPAIDSASAQWRASTSIMMGIDYKHARIRDLQSAGDFGGARLIASVHLAEWVVVVEGISGDSAASIWEVVYDGSSGAPSTIIQLARFGKSLIVDPPEPGTLYESGELDCGTLPLLKVPMRIGKSN